MTDTPDDLARWMRNHVESRGGPGKLKGKQFLPNGVWQKMLDAADLLEQQAARIAELEAEASDSWIELLRTYNAELRKRGDRIATLEAENARLRDEHSKCDRLTRLISKFRDKKYRDSYVRSHTKTFLANQMRAFRGDLTQKEFSEKLDVSQSMISERFENPNYGKWSLQTLFETAEKLNVAVFVRFVDFETFLTLSRDMSSQAVLPREFDNSEFEARAALKEPHEEAQPPYDAPQLEAALLGLLKGEHSSLTVSFNEMNGPNYQTVRQYIEQSDDDIAEWVSDEEKARAMETNRMWLLQWYAHTPVGFCAYAASSLDAVLCAALKPAEEPAEC